MNKIFPKIFPLIIIFILKSTCHAGHFTGDIKLYFGFVTKVYCEGKLLASAVGNDELIKLEPLPKEIGCGVVLKPIQKFGKSNLLIETSTGTIQVLIEVLNKELHKKELLEIFLKGETT